MNVAVNMASDAKEFDFETSTVISPSYCSVQMGYTLINLHRWELLTQQQACFAFDCRLQGIMQATFVLSLQLEAAAANIESFGNVCK